MTRGRILGFDPILTQGAEQHQNPDFWNILLSCKTSWLQTAKLQCLMCELIKTRPRIHIHMVHFSTPRAHAANTFYICTPTVWTILRKLSGQL